MDMISELQTSPADAQWPAVCCVRTARCWLLPVSNDVSIPMHTLQVKRRTFLSQVALDLGLPLESLIQQNADRLTDLGAWLEPGQELLACGVRAGASIRFCHVKGYPLQTCMLA